MKRKTRLLRPTISEEAAINRGIATDSDTRELETADFKRMQPLREILKRRGRPKSATHKIPVTLRLDAQIVDFFRTSGHWLANAHERCVGGVRRQNATNKGRQESR
ncbi:MAG: BrnA antitoxin family protein [Steroidobacteraceae bacterium]|jgi:uncharacterized protein (DUF4415 family)